MNFLGNLIKSEEERKRFIKEYDEHIGLKKKKEPERKFQFGVKLQSARQ